ncbi:MAG: hypothetical protein Kow0031_36080 [Anaerolineae bacterium]
MSHKAQHKPSAQQIFLIFLVYAVVIFIILALINYMVFPLMYIFSLVGVSVVGAAIATFLHVRSGNRSGVDDIADKLHN